MYKDKICKGCGEKFTPASASQMYCKKDVIRICQACGKSYTDICCSKPRKTCGDDLCKNRNIITTPRICRTCGDEFIPTSSHQSDCNKHIVKYCVICGKPFDGVCSKNDVRHTCYDPSCIESYRVQCSIKSTSKSAVECHWCGEPFYREHPSQLYCSRQHYNTCAICGKRFPIDTIVNLKDVRKTCSDECSKKLKFIDGKQLSEEANRKRRKTNLIRYGFEHPSQNPTIHKKAMITYYNRTGYKHQSHNPISRKSGIKSAKASKLENRIYNIFNQYKLNVIPQYNITKGDLSHVYDFYLPDYKLLIDADGIYYHSYISDPDGRHVRDDYDEVRIKLIPNDHIFHVIVERNEERGIKYILDYIQNIDNSIYTYDTELFKWCRDVGFPYPQYSESRMKKDYERLVAYSNDKYHPYARLGDSIIRHFHKSIYDAIVTPYISPKTAWDNDELLRKVIANRLIYKNDVDPSKILSGFNISKICPRVSIFNPNLGKYICNKYLSEFDVVFDPFSGFSGRMLGVTATNKQYIGQDLNPNAVHESKKIIDLLSLNATVTIQDVILDSDKTYPCLLTCPPYGKKERYNSETIFKSCDEWITLIINKYKCDRFVFVVDKTEEYKKYVVEEIKSPSHFNTVTEKLIVI